MSSSLPLRRLPAALLVACVLATPAAAWAVGGPSPSAVSPQTLHLPTGPSSIHGLEDNAQVSVFSGQVNYSVAIETPADRGAKPDLAFTYSGDLGNGPLGIGWSLGSASIRRSLRQGVPTYGASDELELVGLGGGRLISIGNGEYRIEGRANAVRVVDENGGFRLYDSKGTQYTFGTTSAGRITSGTHVASWWLQQVTMLDGAQLLYDYRADGNNLYLNSVSWGPSQAFSATFQYVSRPDVSVSYKTGFKITTALLLQSVQVQSFGQLLRTYTLDYDQSFSLARLQHIVETGRSGSGTLPVLTFSYQTSHVPQTVALGNLEGWTLRDPRYQLHDVDGDGMVDLVWVESGRHAYKHNHGGGFDAASTISGGAGLATTNARFVDLNGDSRAELLLQFNQSWLPYRIVNNAWTVDKAWAGGDGLSVQDSTYRRFVDLNGDGRVDLVTTNGRTLSVKLNSANGYGAWLSKPLIAPTTQLDDNLTFTDINGDGLADAIYITASGLYSYLGKGDGTFDPYLQNVALPTGAAGLARSNLRFVDLDRDGLVDLVVAMAGSVNWYRGHADGSFAAIAVQLPRPSAADNDVLVDVADLNGNGSQDVVWSSSSGMWILDLAGDTSAGMLAGIDNGLGKTVTIGYAPSAQLAVTAAQAGQPWQRLLQVSMPVPVKMTIDPGAGAPPRVVTYNVRDGFWDGGERRFGGFLQGDQQALGVAEGETSYEHTVFLAGEGTDRELRGMQSVHQSGHHAGVFDEEQDSVWVAQAVAGLPDVPLLHRALHMSQTTTLYEGVVTPVVEATQYQYDGEGRAIVEQQLGRVDVVGDERTVQRSYASDDSTWVRDEVYDEKHLDASGTLVAETNHYFGDDSSVLPLGQVGRGWPRVTQGLLRDANGDRWVTQSSSSYDSLGNPISVMHEGITRTLGYEPNGLHPVSESLQPSPSQTLTWQMHWDDVLGQPDTMTDPNGAVTHVVYDGLGRVQNVSVDDYAPYIYYVYDWTAPLPRTTTYEFDGALANLGPFAMQWTASGQWRQVVNVANGAGEPLYHATRLADSQWIIGDWHEHDSRGHVTFAGDPFYWNDATLPTTRPATLTGQALAYDGRGRTTVHSLPTGAQRSFAYAAVSTTVTEDGTAPVTHYFDGLGRIQQTQRTVDGQLETVDAVYDSLNQVRVMRLQGSVEHTFSFDTLGRMVHAQDPDIGARDLTYDDANRLIAQTNGAGQTIQYQYDDTSRLLRSLGADGTAMVFHYDAAKDGSLHNQMARLAWVEEPDGELDLEYDHQGRQTTRSRTILGQTASEQMTMSASGLLLGSQWDDGFSVNVTRDAAGRAVQLGSYWAADLLDAAGRTMAEHYGNGLTQTYQRDPLGLTSGVQVKASDRTLYDVGINRTPWGAIKTVDDHDGVGLDHQGTFDYDGAGRLKSATAGGGAAQYQFGYQYDGLQNMISRQATGPRELGILSGAYHYGENGHGPRQLTSIVGAAATVTFDYDGAGRQVRQDGEQLVYNGLDQLIRVQKSDDSGAVATVVEHGYGYDGQRTFSRTPDGGVRYWFSDALDAHDGKRDHYLQVDSRLVARVTLPATTAPAAASTNAAGHTLLGGFLLLLLGGMTHSSFSARGGRRYLQLGSWIALFALLSTSCGLQHHFGEQRAADSAGAETLYYHQGVAAGPSLLTRPDGTVYEERRFEPFGQPIDAYRESAGTSEVGTVDFVGEPRNSLNKNTDPSTGWSYHGARWMAPQTARWLTPDPPVKAPDAGYMEAPWNLHPYQYVGQNPVQYWDPDGHFLHLIAGAVVGAAVGTAFEAWHEYKAGNGFSTGRLVGAGVVGAATGLAAAATGGASLLVQGGTAIGTSIVGGIATRAIAGEKTTATKVIVDGAVGALTFGLIKGGGALLTKTQLGQAAQRLVGKAAQRVASVFGRRGVDLSPSAIRAIRSNEARLAEHEAKLAAYRANPFAFDNKGHLAKNADRPEVLEKIIQGRINHLENEIQNFKNYIDNVKSGKLKL